MNCTEAREILNHLMDGDIRPDTDAAQLHARECRECRAWQASMEQVVGLLDADVMDLPELDVAGAVMCRLPSSHPASVHRQQVAWSVRLVVAFGGTWLLGAGVILFSIFLLSWSWLAGVSAHGMVSEGYACLGASVDAAGAVRGLPGVLYRAGRHVVDGLGGVGYVVGWLLALITTFDVAIVSAVAAVRRRRSVTGVFSF